LSITNPTPLLQGARVTARLMDRVIVERRAAARLQRENTRLE